MRKGRFSALLLIVLMVVTASAQNGLQVELAWREVVFPEAIAYQIGYTHVTGEGGETILDLITNSCFEDCSCPEEASCRRTVLDLPVCDDYTFRVRACEMQFGTCGPWSNSVGGYPTLGGLHCVPIPQPETPWILVPNTPGSGT